MINRNNYQELFLMYVDGELPPMQMEAIDAFCQKHPDLAEELQCLMDTRLDADDNAVYPAKGSLLKLETWDAEALTPLQTSLLEMLDGEHTTTLPAESFQQEWQLLQQTKLTADALSASRKQQWIRLLPWDAEHLTPVQQQLLEAVETGASLPDTLLADIETHKEWLLLQQTILAAAPADAMPHKEKLYRYQQETVPVRRLGWWRIAAAAAVLAGIGWLLVDSFDSRRANSRQDQLSSQVVSPIPAPNVADSPALTMPVPAKQAPSVMLAANSTPTKPQPTNTQSLATTVAQKEVPANTTNSGNESEIAREIAAFRLDKVAGNALEEENANVPNLQIRRKAPINARNHQDALDIVAANQGNQVSPMRFSNAVINEDALEDDEYVIIAGARVKKQKLRGVLRTVTRKVGRSFEKSSVTAAEDADLR